MMVELATKSDLLAMKQELQGSLAELRAEIRYSFASLRAEMRYSFAGIRDTMDRMCLQITVDFCIMWSVVLTIVWILKRVGLFNFIR
jgi:hypothetical protein